VNLAKAIAKRDSRAKIAVVGVDSTKPLIPILFPDSGQETSLGRLLSCEKIDENAILEQMNMHDKIGYLGYSSGENLMSHAFPTNEIVDEFLMQMRHFFNYTIIDCTSINSYRLTTKSLIGADSVLYLISCDVDGLAFFNSQESILLSEQYGYNDYLRCVTINGRFSHDVEAMKNALVRVDGVIPYCEKIPQMWNEGKALNAVPDSDYSRTLVAIADDVMGVS
jgi:hypothetical protein